MWTSDNIRVFTASLLGFGAPASNCIIDLAEPFFRVLVLAGQFGVAVATIVYIAVKCKNSARSTRRRK